MWHLEAESRPTRSTALPTVWGRQVKHQRTVFALLCRLRSYRLSSRRQMRVASGSEKPPNTFSQCAPLTVLGRQNRHAVLRRDELISQKVLKRVFTAAICIASYRTPEYPWYLLSTLVRPARKASKDNPEVSIKLSFLYSHNFYSRMRPTNSHLENAHGSASSVQSVDAAWKTSQGLQLPLVRDSSDESRISVESRALWVRRIAEF
jgi:hypothetical protein